MGHDKLRKFAENKTFSCLLEPSAQEVLADGYEHLRDHPIKGHWFRKGDQGGVAASPDAPLVLELGCGKGEYTLELARRNPGRNYVGVDIKGARLWRGAKTATQENMPNVAFLRSRIEFITAFFAPGEVSEIWLTFSDPQPQSENKRLTSPLFLDRYRSIMAPGGVVHLKTDSRFLYEYTLAVIAANDLKLIACTTDLYASSSKEAQPSPIGPEVRGVQTFYESMFLEQGVPITYLSFIIDHDGPYVYPEQKFDPARWRELDEGRRSFSHKDK